ncbi:hypothetical protein AAFF_G00224100 [Aldrovandia affinis]|uniref:Uncharacterized protein n=1 Tax=Aldrovandia affinis TaxID=143900 RepID=A0AAD7X217_9TELE|nr:hypothetical protein AAFF_G00224100 [Aldrovandia affinis]
MVRCTFNCRGPCLPRATRNTCGSSIQPRWITDFGVKEGPWRPSRNQQGPPPALGLALCIKQDSLPRAQRACSSLAHNTPPDPPPAGRLGGLETHWDGPSVSPDCAPVEAWGRPQSGRTSELTLKKLSIDKHILGAPAEKREAIRGPEDRRVPGIRSMLRQEPAHRSLPPSLPARRQTCFT